METIWCIWNSKELHLGTKAQAEIFFFFFSDWIILFNFISTMNRFVFEIPQSSFHVSITVFVSNWISLVNCCGILYAVNGDLTNIFLFLLLLMYTHIHIPSHFIRLRWNYCMVSSVCIWISIWSKCLHSLPLIVGTFSNQTSTIVTIFALNFACIVSFSSFMQL